MQTRAVIKFIGSVYERLRRSPKRVVFPEGTEPRVQRAAARFVKLGLGTPILLGGGQLQVIYWAANKRSGANLSNHLCTGDASAPVGYARVNQSARPDGGTGGSGRLASQCGLHPARRGASRHCGCAIGLWRAELGCYWARPAWCCVF